MASLVNESSRPGAGMMFRPTSRLPLVVVVVGGVGVVGVVMTTRKEMCEYNGQYQNNYYYYYNLP